MIARFVKGNSAVCFAGNKIVLYFPNVKYAD